MALSSDLIGLGVSPLIALRTASAGNGPLTMSGVLLATTGTTAYASTPKIQCTQFLLSANNGTNNSTYAIGLPLVGGDAGAFIGDDFVINNGSSAPLLVVASAGITISVGGTINSNTVLTTHSTMTCYPISTTAWVGVKGS